MKKIMLLLVAVLMSALLTGCGSLSYIKTAAANGFDSMLDISEEGTCNDPSVGAVMRKYGKSKAEFNRWRNFCFGEGIPYVEWVDKADTEE